MPRSAPLAACLLLLVAAPPDADAQDVAAGRSIARQKCAPCHAVGRSGESRVRAAPAFRTLAGRYDVDDLEEALVEGIAVKHGDVEMPEFQFTPAAAAALIAYIKSVGKK